MLDCNKIKGFDTPFPPIPFTAMGGVAAWDPLLLVIVDSSKRFSLVKPKTLEVPMSVQEEQNHIFLTSHRSLGRSRGEKITHIGPPATNATGGTPRDIGWSSPASCIS